MSGFSFIAGQGRHYGIPARDLTQVEYEALTPSQQRIVRESPAYVAVALDDPLGEIVNVQYAELSPAEKGARTRKANAAQRDAGDESGTGEA